MSTHRGVAAVTRTAGARVGSFLDDLTNPNVGSWPNEAPNVRVVRISEIDVKTGAVVDSVKVTYLMADGSFRSILHGGTGGNPNLNISLASNQKLIAVYGRRLNNSGQYGQRNIVQLSFVIATEGSPGGTDAPTVTVQTASAGKVTDPNTQFDFSWPLVGFNSYTDKPTGQPTAYLQGLGFSELLCVSGPTL